MVPVKRFPFGVLLALSLPLNGCTGCLTQLLPPPSSAERGPVLTVEAVYPGAGANQIADEVAAPLEPQIAGTEKLRQMRSEAAADGTYLLELSFERGADLDQAKMLVQNRINLALPVLPQPVTRPGLTLRTKRPSLIAILTLSSPDGSRVVRDLRDYADHTLKAELDRVPEIEQVTAFRGVATFDGAPIVAIGVYPRREALPRRLALALGEKVARLKTELPPGFRLEFEFDFPQTIEAADSAMMPEYLLLEVHTPESASTERIVQVLHRCETVLRGIDRVQDALTLTHPIFERGSFPASVLVRLAATRVKGSTRDAVVKTIRDRLGNELPDALIRVRDLAGHSRFPSCSYPLDLAVVDTENRGYDTLRALAEQLAEKLEQSGEITDAMASRGSLPLEGVSVLVDLKQAEALGLPRTEIVRPLEDYFAGVGSELNLGPGSLSLKAGPFLSRREAEQLSQLKIRGSDGRMVPLVSVAQVRQIQYARSLERVDGLPMVRITADFLTGLSPADARARCERVIKEFAFPAGYQVRWLSASADWN
jgi:multidrug efflux pump subunit AcrB